MISTAENGCVQNEVPAYTVSVCSSLWQSRQTSGTFRNDAGCWWNLPEAQSFHNVNGRPDDGQVQHECFQPRIVDSISDEECVGGLGEAVRELRGIAKGKNPAGLRAGWDLEAYPHGEPTQPGPPLRNLNVSDPVKRASGIFVQDQEGQYQPSESEVGPGEEATDSQLQGALRAATLHVYLRFTLGAAGALDRHASDFAEALNKSSSHSVLFSSKPHAAYAAKPMGKARTLLLAVGWLLYAATQLRDALGGGAGLLAPSLLRLRTLDAQNPIISSGTVVVARFGLLRDDCVVSSALGPGPSPGDALANGYHFALAADGPGLAGWAVQASDDNGTSWAPVAPCAWVTVQTWSEQAQDWVMLGGGSSWLTDCVDGGVREVELATGALVRVGYGQGESFTWLAIGFVAVPLGWLCALLAAMLGRVHLVQRILVVTLAGWAVWSLGWQAASWPSMRDARRSLYLLFAWITLPAAFSAVGFHVLERRLVFVFFVDGLLFLLGFVLLCAENFGLASLRPALATNPPFALSLALGLYLTFSAAIFYWLRWRVVRRARQLVLQDRRRYDSFWAEVLQSQGADCLDLRAKAQALIACLPAATPQQMTRSQNISRASPFRRLIHPKEPVLAGEGGLNVSSWWNRHVFRLQARAVLYPLFSLDQLFVQAVCAFPLLLRKVQQWAAASCGLFPCQRLKDDNCVTFAKFAEQNRFCDFREGFKWCRLKSVPRAVEKVIRAYGLDVSRLVDVCRQVKSSEKTCLLLVADLLAGHRF